MNSKRTRKKYNKNSKILIIMVLTVGVIVLSIGFSAFSNNLNINSTATVNPDPSNFKVLFSSSPTSVIDGTVSASPYTGSTFASFFQATINNSNLTSPQITGLKGTFAVPNSSGQYVFYAFNEGIYTAYLKKITFGSKKCTAKQGTTQALVDEACRHIRLEVQVALGKWYSGSATLTGHPLEKGKSEKIIVWMGYDHGNTGIPHLADGDFDVEFGDITLTYSTSDS